MRNPSTRRKNTVRRAPTLGDVEEKERDDDDAAPTTLNNSSPYVAGEFQSALETLFETLEETQTWYVFCVNPNASQLPNQLEGRSVKGQIRSLGLTEIARRCVNVSPVMIRCHSGVGTGSYAPSRDMFQNVDKKALLEKEALPSEIHEGEPGSHGTLRRHLRVGDNVCHCTWLSLSHTLELNIYIYDLC
jgi:hypothetical protein